MVFKNPNNLTLRILAVKKTYLSLYLKNISSSNKLRYEPSFKLID